MTMPHLENCLHVESGWCAECVKKLGDENQDLRLAVLEASRITFLIREEGGERTEIEVKWDDHEQFDLASRLISDCCKKWLI